MSMKKLVEETNVREILNGGYVRLRAVHGSDLMVVDAARVSFDKKSEWEYIPDTEWDELNRLLWEISKSQRIREFLYRHNILTRSLPEQDKRLIRFLAKHEHWSPFSHPHISFEIKVPIMVVNQLYKHRIGSRFTEGGDETFDDAWNEMSGRYVSEHLGFYIPTKDQWRSAPKNRKQGSGSKNLTSLVGDAATGDLDLHIRESISLHTYYLSLGMAPEQARLFLPYAAMFTKLFWTPSLATLIRFLRQRLDPHAQWEIQQLANAIWYLTEPYFPVSFDAYDLEFL